MAYTGCFNKSKLTFGGSDTIADQYINMLDHSIFAVDVVEPKGELTNGYFEHFQSGRTEPCARSRLPSAGVFPSHVFDDYPSHKSFLIDIEKKKTRFLPLHSAMKKTARCARDGYDTITFTPPKVGASRNITAKDLETRLPGQSIVEISAETASSEAVMSGLVIEDMLDLQRSIERREEQQIIEILSTW